MKDATEIVVILDRSGSMKRIEKDTIGGFNNFLSEQKTSPGEANISLYLFDNQYERVYEGIPLKDAKELDSKTFVPRGWTSLLDAVGMTIAGVGQRLSAIPEVDRPSKVVVMIMTDGEENNSKEYTYSKVAEMIQHQKDKYGWQFIFLGANQDAIANAAKIGIGAGSSLTYSHNAVGTKNAMRSTSKLVSSARVGAQSVYSSSDRDDANQP